MQIPKYARHSLAVNRQGPYVPAWFKVAIRRIDPKLVVQYTPPDNGVNNGIDPQMFPWGCVDICTRTKHTGILSPVVTWSLANLDGTYAPPTRHTLRLIRRAYQLHRQGESKKLERSRDEALREMRLAVCRKSIEDFRTAIGKYCRAKFGRQWENRIFLRNQVPMGA